MNIKTITKTESRTGKFQHSCTLTGATRRYIITRSDDQVLLDKYDRSEDGVFTRRDITARTCENRRAAGVAFKLAAEFYHLELRRVAHCLARDARIDAFEQQEEQYAEELQRAILRPQDKLRRANDKLAPVWRKRFCAAEDVARTPNVVAWHETDDAFIDGERRSASVGEFKTPIEGKEYGVVLRGGRPFKLDYRGYSTLRGAKAAAIAYLRGAAHMPQQRSCLRGGNNGVPLYWHIGD